MLGDSLTVIVYCADDDFTTAALGDSLTVIVYCAYDDFTTAALGDSLTIDSLAVQITTLPSLCRETV